MTRRLCVPLAALLCLLAMAGCRVTTDFDAEARREHGSLHPPPPAAEVEQDPRDQHGQAGVRTEIPGGDQGDQRRQRQAQGRKGPHGRGEQHGPGQRQNHRRRAPEIPPLPQPVHALPDNGEDGEGGHDAVHGVEAVRPDQNAQEAHRQQQPGHERRQGVDPQKVGFPAPGVGESPCWSRGSCSTSAAGGGGCRLPCSRRSTCSSIWSMWGWYTPRRPILFYPVY